MSAKTSGLLRGGGVRGLKKRRNVVRGGSLRHIPDVHLSDYSALRALPPFDDDLSYSPRELNILTEKILLEDSKDAREDPVYLTVDCYIKRIKHEIFCSNGTPEPHVVHGLYWRTHPNGRAFVGAPEDRVKNRSAFYR